MQLTLTYDIEIKTAPPHWSKFRTQEQEDAFQDLLSRVRQEAEIFLKIANELYPDKGWKKGSEVPTPVIAEVRAIYDSLSPEEQAPKPDPVPIAWVETPLASGKKPRKVKEYRPWSEERKQRDHVRRLWERARKRYSLMPMLVDYVQGELAQNPQYYGVCSLPGAIASCKVNIPSPERLAAIAYEQELRLQEAGLQPVRLPLKLEMPEMAPLENSLNLEAMDAA